MSAVNAAVPMYVQIGFVGGAALAMFLMINQAIAINKARQGEQSTGFGYTLMILTLILEIGALIYFIAKYLKASGKAQALKNAAAGAFARSSGVASGQTVVQ